MRKRERRDSEGENRVWMRNEIQRAIGWDIQNCLKIQIIRFREAKKTLLWWMKGNIRHIIMKLQINEDKENILKEARGKKTNYAHPPQLKTNKN